jgi:MFS family permease
MLSGPACGWLSDRFGPTWFATIGAGLVTLSFALTRTFDLQTPVTTIVPVLILSGIGVGAFQPSNNSMIMGNVARDRLGTGSALIATMRQVGISVGMALAGTVFAARQAVYESELTLKGFSQAEISRVAIPPAFHDALLIAVLLGLAATLLSLITGIRAKR